MIQNAVRMNDGKPVKSPADRVRNFAAWIAGFLFWVSMISVLVFIVFARMTSETAARTLSENVLKKTLAEWNIATNGSSIYALDTEDYKKFVKFIEKNYDPMALETAVTGFRMRDLRQMDEALGMSNAAGYLAGYLRQRNLFEVSELLAASQKQDGVTGLVRSLIPPVPVSTRGIAVESTVRALVSEFFVAYFKFEQDLNFKAFDRALYGIQGRHSAEIDSILKFYDYSISAFMQDYGNYAVSEVAGYDGEFAAILAASGGSLEPIIYAVRKRMKALYYDSISNNMSVQTNAHTLRFETSRMRKAGALTVAGNSDLTLIPLTELNLRIVQRIASLVILASVCGILFMLVAPGFSKLYGLGIALFFASIPGLGFNMYLDALWNKIAASPAGQNSSLVNDFIIQVRNTVQSVFYPVLLISLILFLSGIIINSLAAKRGESKEA